LQQVSESAASSGPQVLSERLRSFERLFVLTGAGLSTDSGIPDYRDDQGEYRRGPPMQFRVFRDDLAARQRYWARSLAGFSRVDRAEPNAGHRALVDLERQGRVELVVTQNVDGLQQKAGSERVLELHGRLSLVSCLACGRTFDRMEFQRRLVKHNPSFTGLVSSYRPAVRAQSVAAAGDGCRA
jgi:NAD-dependent SIR2 family protein deacetylase